MVGRGGRRGIRGSFVGIVAGLFVVGAPALAAHAGSTPNEIVRTAPSGRVPQRADVATTGSRVAVTWVETDDGEGGSDDPRVFLRTTADRGQTWGATILVESGEYSDQPSVAICDGRYLMLVYVVDLRIADLFPRRWRVILYQRDLVTGEDAVEEVSTGSERAQYPDVACGSDRVWITWDDKETTERHVFLRHGVVKPPGEVDLVPAIDLGRSRPTGNSTASGPGVAAVDGDAYVVWGGWKADGVKVRFKHYLVGPGPGHAVTPTPTFTLKSMGEVPRHPLVAASGDWISVVYPLGFDRFGLMRSGDRGGSFGAQKVLRIPEPYGGEANHLSMRGSRILIFAAAYFKGPADTIRYLSTNHGETFTRTSLDNNRGGRVGGFVTGSGTPRAVEVWDGYWYNDRKLRFRRDT